MKFLKIYLIIVLGFMFSGKAGAQEYLEPSRYQGDLVAYLTEVNMWLEGYMVTNYCNCAENEDFLKNYQKVRASYNAWLNSAVTKLGLMKGRKAVRAFQNVNRSEWLNSNAEMNRAFQDLMRFSETDVSACSNRGIIPGIVTVAELTAIANSVVELINETKKRREEQKLLIIQTLEDLKIPPLQDFECSG